MNKEELKEMAKDLKKCAMCGAPIVPDKEAVTFGTKKWDGHSFKFSCDCHSKDIRISIG